MQCLVKKSLNDVCYLWSPELTDGGWSKHRHIKPRKEETGKEISWESKVLERVSYTTGEAGVKCICVGMGSAQKRSERTLFLHLWWICGV